MNRRPPAVNGCGSWIVPQVRAWGVEHHPGAAFGIGPFDRAVTADMLAKAALGTAMPKAGGTYFFIERSLGPIMGTYGGLANWFSLSFKSAFALVGIGEFTILVFPLITPMQIKLIAVACCLIFTVK